MAKNLVERIDESVAVRHVLMSVSDKTGLESLVPGLVAAAPAIKIFSTGGTYNAVREILGEEAAARHLVSVADYTGQPEMQGGLVKTLDFKIYLGLLSETYNIAHQEDLRRVAGVAFDMVVVNLYPFQATVCKPGATPEEARANIDIGGPCMLRAAAKNFLRVAAVSDPADYARLLDELRTQQGAISLATRLYLMQKAFQHTAEYDAAIAAYFDKRERNQLDPVYELAER